MLGVFLCFLLHARRLQTFVAYGVVLPELAVGTETFRLVRCDSVQGF